MPGDFREFFDPRNLDERKRGEIEFVLVSPAYNDSFKPYIEGVLRQLNDLWKDRSQARKDQYPDEFLAGGAVFGEGLLKFFEVLIQEVSMERIHEAMEHMTPDVLYELRRERGEVKTVTGLDQEVTPEVYRPEDDF